MTVLVLAETALLVLAILLIVGLLRSHADILRRLTALEGGPAAAPRTAAPAGARAADLSGETPWGDSVKLSLQGAGQPTLLAFLSSGCGACGSLWEGLQGGSPVAGARTVVVTQGIDAESRPRVRELAPDGCEVVMSSEAWRSYGIPGSPHFVLVDGGRIAGEGAAASWGQIGALVAQAAGDLADGDGSRTTGERAQRAEEALAAAGIHPGHPSLHGGDRR